MNILLSTTETWLLCGGIVAGVILLIAIILFLTCGLRSKREKKNKIEHVIVDEVFMNDLISGMGELENICNVTIDNGRVKFKVKDLDLLNTDLLKKLSTSGVFITGNNVKLLFKYDSVTILQELVNRGVAQC